jgi:hypothetical protein
LILGLFAPAILPATKYWTTGSSSLFPDQSIAGIQFISALIFAVAMTVFLINCLSIAWDTYNLLKADR